MRTGEGAGQHIQGLKSREGGKHILTRSGQMRVASGVLLAGVSQAQVRKGGGRRAATECNQNMTVVFCKKLSAWSNLSYSNLESEK